MCVCVRVCGECVLCAILILYVHVYLEGIGTTTRQPHETTKIVNKLNYMYICILWSTLKTDTTMYTHKANSACW